MLWESLRGADTAIRVRLGTDPRLYAWGLRFLRECTTDRSRRNTLVKLGLCQYSQAVMDALVRAEGIEYHAIAQGALYVHRDPRELDAGIKKMALLAEHGQRQEVLDPGALARLDPVFAPVQGKIAGAIRDLGDASGDSRLFVENLTRRCQESLGVTVKLGARVTGLRAEGDLDRRRAHEPGHAGRRQLRARAGGRQPRRRAHGGPLAAHLPGQGLLVDLPAARRAASPRPSPASTKRGWSRGRASATGCG